MIPYGKPLLCELRIFLRLQSSFCGSSAAHILIMVVDYGQNRRAQWSLLLNRPSFRTGAGQQSWSATVCRSARSLRPSWSDSALSFFLKQLVWQGTEPPPCTKPERPPSCIEPVAFSTKSKFSWSSLLFRRHHRFLRRWRGL